jgi:hypothetical protein
MKGVYMYKNQYLNTKKWSSCQLNELQAGDILLFRPSKKGTFAQKAIMLCQTLLHKKQGHYDTVHAGICTGNNDLLQPMIAHVTIVANKPNAYQHEPLQTMLDREEGDRPFIVYRSNNREFANEAGRVAQTISPQKKFTWSMASAATSLAYYPTFNFSPQSSETKKIDSATFCSRFVIQVMKKAACNTDFADLRSRSTPKALESFLDKRKDFEKLCYLGNNPCSMIENEIQKQIIRLSQQKNKMAQEKFALANAAFKNAQLLMAENVFFSEAEKINHLLNVMLPIFKINTGWNLTTATSYTAVSGLARKMGIFKKDLPALDTRATLEQHSGYVRLAS